MESFRPNDAADGGDPRNDGKFMGHIHSHEYVTLLRNVAIR